MLFKMLILLRCYFFPLSSDSFGILCYPGPVIWVWERGNNLKSQLVLSHRKFGFRGWVSGQRRLGSCNLSCTNPLFLASSLSGESPPRGTPKAPPHVLLFPIMASSYNFLMQGCGWGSEGEGMPHSDNSHYISCYWNFTLHGVPSALPQDHISFWLGMMCGSPFPQKTRG